MKLGQIEWNGRRTAAIFDTIGARPIPGFTMLELIVQAESDGETLESAAWRRGANETLPGASPLLPIDPPEVWGCGCTYESSASFRDAEHGTREGFYAAVYRGERPEVFFKGTARVCSGPGQPIGIRFDSKFTAPEPELALILGTGGTILGYTLANDVSAWDIERENPLYLTQSKIYRACCALGPVIVTAPEIPDPKNLDMTCRITRGDRVTFEGAANTARLTRSLDTLVAYLTRSNPVPVGTVVLTGTGIIVTEAAALAPGDVVSIRVAQIGELVNPVVMV
jgi:2-dehydro-3-deoxy-D-arabinonate dehydratase